MTDIKVNVSAEDVEKVVSEAIINSVIGETIKKQVNELLKGGYRFTNAIDSTIQGYVNQEIQRCVKEQAELINSEVIKKITPELISEIVDKGLKSLRGY